MKREFINKIILGTMISTSLFTLVPTKASAEWGSDYQGNWYYMNNNSKVTGWTKIDGQLYYFDENGVMKKGWIKAGDSWYYLQDNGAVKTGWVNYTNNWYYADSTGAIQTGTLNIAGKVYIFDNNGIMKTSNTVINGQFYTISSNGEVVGANIPTPDKELDVAGNVVRILNGNSTTISGSPIDSKFNEVIEDKTVSKADPNEGRTFQFSFRDSNGSELDTKKVKYGKSVDLYTPTKTDYTFAGWNTKSDGSGKSYDSSDSIKIKEDTTLYAQWSVGTVYADSISITGDANVTVDKTIQMSVAASPSNATIKELTWTVVNGTGEATIDSSGVLKGVSSGTVTVKASATAKDGSKLVANKSISVKAAEITNPGSGGQATPVAVDSVSIGTENSTIPMGISTDGGTLKLVANILPANATNKTVLWSITEGQSIADISQSTGVLKAKANGTVTVQVRTVDGDKIATQKININNQSIKISKITINSPTTINGAGTQKMTALLEGQNGETPTNTSLIWTVENKTGSATIDEKTGELTPKSNGTVTVKATAADGSGVSNTEDVTITGLSAQVAATSIKILGKGDISSPAIVTDDGELELDAIIGPSYATTTPSSITWTVETGANGGSAIISGSNKGSSIIIKAVDNGTVVVRATVNDGISKVTGTITVTIDNQVKQVEKIEINPPAVTQVGRGENLQLTAKVTTPDPKYSKVTWKVVNGTGTAKFDNPASGILIGGDRLGDVQVVAVSTDGYGLESNPVTITVVEAVKATKVDVTSDSDTITVDKGTTKLTAAVDSLTTNKKVTWSIDDTYVGANGKGKVASIVDNGDSTATITADESGDVKVVATGSGGVSGFKVITISGQKARSLSPIGIGGMKEVTAGQSLQMDCGAMPLTATTSAGVAWSVDDTSKATIDSNGILTAWSVGIVNVTAKTTDPKLTGTTQITLKPINNFIVNDPGNSVVEAGGQVKLTSNLSSIIAVDQSKFKVKWSIINGGSNALIHFSDGNDGYGYVVADTGSKGTTIEVQADLKDQSGNITIATAKRQIVIQ